MDGEQRYMVKKDMKTTKDFLKLVHDNFPIRKFGAIMKKTLLKHSCTTKTVFKLFTLVGSNGPISVVVLLMKMTYMKSRENQELN